MRKNAAPPSLAKRNPLPFLIVTFAILFCGFYYSIGWALWHDFSFFPLPIGTDWMTALKFKVVSILIPWTGIGQAYPSTLSQLNDDAAGEIIKRFQVPGILGFMLASLGLLGLYFRNPTLFSSVLPSSQNDSDDTIHIRHVRGRQLFRGRAAREKFAVAAEADCKVGGEGLRLHPSFPSISLDRETRHFLVMGSTGGGKTQAISPIVAASQERGDRLFVFDNKGDYTTNFNGKIICPWDSRSMIWDIASDCCTKMHAKELTARLIQESKDPMWANAARQVLTGLVLKLQNEKPRAWGWGDLAALISLPQPELLEIMRKYFPEGIRAVEDASKTTQSILINLSAYMAIVYDLADAWPTPDQKRAFSFTNWLLEEGKEKSVQTVIVQGSKQFAELQKAYIGGIIDLMSSVINSPKIGESKERKIWLFLDELPQLGKIDGLAPMFEIGRSKGIRVVIGLQDVNQLRKVYDKETADAWFSMIGTHIYARILPGETANSVSDFVGNREVERQNISWSNSGADPGLLSRGGSATHSWQRETLPVIMPSQLESELGPSPKGVRCLFLGYNDALIMTWPYTSLEKRRDASRLAAWTGWPDSQKASATLAAQQVAEAEKVGEIEVEAEQEQKRETLQQVDKIEVERAEQQEESATSSEVSDRAEDIASNALDTVLPGLGTALDVADSLGFLDAPLMTATPQIQSINVPAAPTTAPAGTKRKLRRKQNESEQQHEQEADDEQEA